MNYFARVKRMDNLLIVVLLVGGGIIMSLSIVGYVNNGKSAAIDSGCGVEDLVSRITALLKNNSRFIAVVGDGVPGESIVLERPYNTQFAQGYDLYQGVHFALQSMIPKSMIDSIGILYIDDGGNPTCARKIAEILSNEPRLLGVIGHSTTSCTMEAVPFYRRSNIPFIIPAATNPSLLSNHPKNCFRLPSNDEIQSLVIADLVMNKFMATNVFVVWDATPEASQYSEFIKNTVQQFLSMGLGNSPIIEGSYPISLNPLNYSYLFRRIVSSKPDVVIFAGYGSLAREFLLGLDYEYSHYEKKIRPKVILTDGCKIPGISGYGFDTYLTFSAAPLISFANFKKYDPGTRFPQFQKMYLEESFEIFGYDAATMIFTAINDLRKSGQNVTRGSIIHAIANENKKFPTCYTYRFENGENTNHRYYCYSLRKDSITFKYDEETINLLLQRINQ